MQCCVTGGGEQLGQKVAGNFIYIVSGDERNAFALLLIANCIMLCC